MSLLAGCSYCGVPLHGEGFSGRAWPGHPSAQYCCSGCLTLGERAAGGETRTPLDPVWIRLGVAAFLTAQSMVLGLAISISPPSDSSRLIVQGVVLGATLIVVALLAGPLLANGLREIRNRRVSSEALFLTCILGALLASVQSMVRGRGAIYFEVISVLLLVYTIGKTIGAKSRASALAATKTWAGSLRNCRRLDDRGIAEETDVASIRAGDRVEVLPGESIAVDGEIVEGVAFVRESVLSGEPFAVVRRPGDRVWAGTSSEDARIVVRASAPGADRRIDRLIDAVERARLAPTTMAGQADRLLAVFFPIVMVVAVATFVGWTLFESWEVGLFNAMSVLLVACPCAMGMATPVATWTALSRLAERGVIARDGRVLESLASVDRVIFDKTGTLTEAELPLIDLATLDTDPAARARLTSWLAAIERDVAHPVARGFAKLAKASESIRVKDRRVEPGAGIEGRLVDEFGSEHRIRIGREGWLSPDADAEDLALLASRLHADPTGRLVLIEVDGELAAMAAMAETVRASASDCVEGLRRLELPYEVMTGDTAARAASVGFPGATGALSPEDKTREVAARVSAGARSLFVGDGINDAAAMTAAHASIALASGTDIAVEAASATLYGDDLSAIPFAVETARSVVRVVRGNILGAAFYNAVGMALAASGRLHPIAAALLMVGSSLLVVWRSTRLDASDCPCPGPTSEGDEGRIGTLSWVHALTLAAQGPILVALGGLAGLAAGLTVGAFFLAGFASARAWRRIPVSHGWDMAYGMLTLGNLGMTLGWWADLGFGPVRPGHPCCRISGLGSILGQPGMWLGMFVFANLAMIFASRGGQRLGAGHLVLCNVGMGAGMLLGGEWSARLGLAGVANLAFADFVGMGLGMVGGMMAAHAALDGGRRALRLTGP